MEPGQRRPAMAGLLGLALAACLAPADARTQELHGGATLYGWLPGLDADITSSRGSISASTSVSARNVLDALNFAFMAAGEVHYGRFGLLQDFVYSDLGTSGNLSGPLTSKVNVDTTLLISTTAVAYRAYEKGGWLVEPYAGARYVDLEQDVKITGGGPLGLERAASVDLNWWDPVIGVRGRAPITQRLSAGAFVDIGGFGAGSQFSWEVYAGLDYAVTDHVSGVAGFRYLSIDYEDGGADLKLDTYGPVLGATLRF
jgi:opacity protein-like surface antigen